MKACCLITMIALFLLFCTNGTRAQSTQIKPKETVVAYEVAGMNDVIAKKDIPYLKTADSAMKMDIYYPPKFDFKRKIPAIVFVWIYK